MKIRDFKPDAWELCRQHSMPGCVTLAKEAMEFGYKLAVKDITDDLAEVHKDIVELRRKANAPQ